jgi:hypothetical protein
LISDKYEKIIGSSSKRVLFSICRLLWKSVS